MGTSETYLTASMIKNAVEVLKAGGKSEQDYFCIPPAILKSAEEINKSQAAWLNKLLTEIFDTDVYARFDFYYDDES